MPSCPSLLSSYLALFTASIMANPKRHGGHIQPEDIAFPPAHPSAPDTYAHPYHYTPVDPYYLKGSAPSAPATHPPTTPVPAPPGDRRNARHRGKMSPEDACPEKSSAATDAMSTASTKLTKTSGGSPPNKRHGGSKSPEEDHVCVSSLPSCSVDSSYRYDHRLPDRRRRHLGFGQLYTTLPRPPTPQMNADIPRNMSRSTSIRSRPIARLRLCGLAMRLRLNRLKM